MLQLYFLQQYEIVDYRFSWWALSFTYFVSLSSLINIPFLLFVLFCLIVSPPPLCERVSQQGNVENSNICAHISWWRCSTILLSKRNFSLHKNILALHNTPRLVSMHHKLFAGTSSSSSLPAIRFAFTAAQVFLFEKCTGGGFQWYALLAVGFHVRAALSAHQHSNRPLPSGKGQGGISKRCGAKSKSFFFFWQRWQERQKSRD